MACILQDQTLSVESFSFLIQKNQSETRPTILRLEGTLSAALLVYPLSNCTFQGQRTG
jgi:hypothetical protein